MKKWFSSLIFEFRWKKMTKWQRIEYVASLGFMLLSGVLLLIGVSQPQNDNGEIVKLDYNMLAFLFFVWSTPFSSDTMQTEGRINQKYLKEMNEIRKSLGRKEWEEI